MPIGSLLRYHHTCTSVSKQACTLFRFIIQWGHHSGGMLAHVQEEDAIVVGLNASDQLTFVRVPQGATHSGAKALEAAMATACKGAATAHVCFIGLSLSNVIAAATCSCAVPVHVCQRGAAAFVCDVPTPMHGLWAHGVRLLRFCLSGAALL